MDGICSFVASGASRPNPTTRDLSDRSNIGTVAFERTLKRGVAMHEQPVRPAAAKWILAALVVAFGAVMFGWAVTTGHADSALLFVGLPVLLALALVLLPGRTTHGRVFQLTTVFLLLTAVALHEGAICVILAAPLVYGMAHGVTALVRLFDRSSRPYALLPIPLLLLSALEGTSDDLRLHAEQTVTVKRVVAATPEEVLLRVARGPRPTEVRELPLRALAVPMPHHVTGSGLATGDRWVFQYAGTSHGSGGETITRVSAAAADRVDFEVVSDTAITSRWMVWEGGSVRWRAAGARRTEVTMTLTYRRRLDPSWYFGPLQQGLTHEGAGHLLDMLALR
jgi:hypothetical protein